MNGLIIKVLSISIAVVTVVYLIIYKGNTMITKIFSVCIIVAMVIYWIVYERNTRKRKKRNYSVMTIYLRKKTICRYR